MRIFQMIRTLGTLGAMVLILSACQMSLPGLGKAEKSEPATTENPITGGAVETTSLDSPPAQDPAKLETAATAKPTDPKPKARPTTEQPKPEVAPEPVEKPAAEPAPVPAKPKSPSQIACEKSKGVWTQAGSGAAAFCQKPTGDAGKSCKASTDCEGYCLARSGTCAPVSPMFGCQDILNESGRMLTQCIN